MKNSNNKFVGKSWGWEFHIENNDLYCGKILFVKKGFSGSFHSHLLKTETYYLSQGKLKLLVSNDDNISKAEEIILEEGDTYHIPAGVRHQFTAIFDTTIFEVSTPHSDDDVYRITIGN